MTYTREAQPSPRFLYSLSILLLFLCFGAACSHNSNLPPYAATTKSPILTMMPSGENPTDLAFILAELANYRKKTGVQVKAIASYDSIDTRLILLEDIFRKKSPEPDICGIDNIWPGLLAGDLIDLKPYLGDEMTAIDKGLLDVFTVEVIVFALCL